MEKLTRIGEKNRRILATFLKENGIYDEFVMNANEYKKQRKYYYSNNNIFNTQDASNLFDSFFLFSASKYPSCLNISKRFEYWSNFSREWKVYVYQQRYKKYKNIW